MLGSVRGLRIVSAAAALAGITACSFVLGLSEYDSETDVADATTDSAAPPEDAGVEAAPDGCTFGPDNCGECGRTCLGGVCIDGSVCNADHVRADISAGVLLLADSGIYFGSALSEAIITYATYELTQVQATAVFPPNQPTALAIDSNELYWGDSQGAVYAVSHDLDGGTARFIGAGPGWVTGVGFDLGPVWGAWGSDGGIYRPSGQDTSIPSLWGLAQRTDAFYWGTRTLGGVIGRRRSNGQKEILVPDAGVPIGVAVDSAAVYWADCTGGAIRRYDLTTSQVTTLASGQRYPYAVAVDDTYVYWTTLGAEGTPDSCTKQTPGTDEGAVARTRKDGSGGFLVLATDLTGPLAVAVRNDLPYVYWVTGGILGRQGEGGLWRVPK